MNNNVAKHVGLQETIVGMQCMQMPFWGYLTIHKISWIKSLMKDFTDK